MWVSKSLRVVVLKSVRMAVSTMMRRLMLELLSVVVLCVVLLTVMGVMPPRSVHVSLLDWTCTTLPSAEHWWHCPQRSRRWSSQGRS